jgi:hypothetical protein
MVPGKKRVITAAGIEASQAPLIGHHQLTVGLLRANLPSVITSKAAIRDRVKTGHTRSDRDQFI